MLVEDVDIELVRERRAKGKGMDELRYYEDSKVMTRPQ